MSGKKNNKKIRGVFEKVAGSGIWWIQYFANGRRHREKAGSKQNAKDLLTKRRNAVLTGEKLPEKLRARAVSFQQIADAALEYSRAQKSSHQHDTYRMAPLVEKFGDRQADSILPEEFEEWLEEQAEEREWSVATRNRYIALLKLTYRLAERNRKIRSNPARLLRMRKEDNSKVRYLDQYKPLPTKIDYLKACSTEEDRLRRVIATEYPDHLPEFEIALATGMRRSEMYRCTWPNVDLEHHVLTVPRSKHGETRYVTLNSAAQAMLDFLRSKAGQSEKGGESEYVFLSMRNHAPLTGNRHWFEDAVEKAGLKDFTWHCLRHTFGSRLAARGVDLRKIQELMGHKTLAVTVRYTHLSQTDLLAAVEQLVSPRPISGAPTATTTATSDKVKQAVGAN
jgi:site-specific recombinase XerD